MIPKHVDDAVEKADKIAKRTWPPVWRFPVPSQADAVWDALKPARDFIEAQTGETMERNENDHIRKPVVDAEAKIMAISLPVNPPNPANAPFTL